MSRPAELGYRMPAEWSPHAGCWMAWPCRPQTFADMDAARRAYAVVAQAITVFEPVTMIVRPDDAKDAARLLGEDIGILPMPLDDSWMRDIGPTFVVDMDGQVAGNNWQFNAWGGNFPDHANDAAVAGRILTHLGLPAFEADFVLEGGSIHTDGDGTLLVSEQCLLNENRNPGLSKADIEDRLRGHLGVSAFVWLGRGLVDDETDGHVDNLACFVRPGVVAALTANDPKDANYEALTDNLARLRAARDAQGRPLEIIEIEEPAARVEDGVRLAQSYINFYIANGGVVMPAFDDPPRDRAAYDTLVSAFPGRKIVQVPGLDIVRGGGCIHCITQQQPTGAPI